MRGRPQSHEYTLTPSPPASLPRSMASFSTCPSRRQMGRCRCSARAKTLWCARTLA